MDSVDDTSHCKKPLKNKRKSAVPLDLVSDDDDEEKSVTEEVNKHKKLLQDLSKKVNKVAIWQLNYFFYSV